jgi:DNA-binding protein HU-beta
MEGIAMTKEELVAKVAKDAKVTKAAADKAVKGVFDGIAKALKKGERFIVPGFGSFSVTKRKARNGRNPQTGKPIKIAAKKVAKFKSGAKLSKSIQ